MTLNSVVGGLAGTAENTMQSPTPNALAAAPILLFGLSHPESQ